MAVAQIIQKVISNIGALASIELSYSPDLIREYGIIKSVDGAIVTLEEYGGYEKLIDMNDIINILFQDVIYVLGSETTNIYRTMKEYNVPAFAFEQIALGIDTTQPYKILFVRTPQGPRLYISEQATNTVIVMNPLTVQEITRIQFFEKPGTLIANSAGTEVYIAYENNYAPTVAKLLTSNNSILQAVSFPVGHKPVNLAIDEKNQMIYVSILDTNNPVNSYVRVITTYDYALKATMPTSGVPGAIFVNYPRTKVYIAVNDSTIKIYHATTCVLLGTINLPANALSITGDSTNANLYIVLDNGTFIKMSTNTFMTVYTKSVPMAKDIYITTDDAYIIIVASDGKVHMFDLIGSNNVTFTVDDTMIASTIIRIN